MELKDLTRREKSTLCYLETCAVDIGGLVEARRINGDDFDAIEKFKEAGILEFCAIPEELEDNASNKYCTHWTRLYPAAWALVSLCRQERSSSRGPYAQKVREALIKTGEAKVG